MPRGRIRVCPYCGNQSMTLWNAGYTGTIYHCANCSYTGPVVIELEEEKPRSEIDISTKARISSISNTLDLVATIAGGAFIAIGLVTVIGAPFLPNGNSLPSSYSFDLAIIGVLLLLVWPIRLARMVKRKVVLVSKQTNDYRS